MFGLGLILLPAIENMIFWKDRRKRYVFVTLDSGCFEIVFALLTKIIALYMQITIIEI